MVPGGAPQMAFPGQLANVRVGGGGLFSVEKAICPSVSSERLVPTGRKRDGYLKMGRRQDEKRRGGMQERMMKGRKEGRNGEG